MNTYYNIHVLRNIPNKFRNNKAYMLKKVKKNGLNLQFASTELRNDEEIVLNAVKQNGLALQFARTKLRNNKEIVITALNQNINVLFFLKKWTIYYKSIINTFNFIDNKELILKIIKIGSIYYKYLNKIIKKDINITKEIIKSNSNILYFALPIMRENVEILLLALDYNINIIEIIPPKILKIKEIVLKIIDCYNLKNQYNKSRLRILHIGFIKLNNKFTEEYIKYKFININLYSIEDIIKYFNSILDIQKKNIVVFIELNTNIFSRYVISEEIILNNKIKIINLYKQLNEIIFNTKIYHVNIKIINILADNNSLNYSNKFYKIVNIAINNSCKNTKSLRYNFNYNIKNTIFKKIKLTNNIIINDMLATHWLNNLINTPKFLRGRQLQISGTCWFNCIFNSLFLVKSIRNEMYLKYKEYKKLKTTNFPIEYKNLRKSNNYNIHDILFSLIGNLKNNTLPVINYGDYMIVIASYIKEYSEYLYKDNKIIDKLYRIKDKNKPLFSLCRASDDNKYRNTLCSNKLNNKEDLDILNNLCFYIRPKSICDTYPKNSDETYGYIYGNSGEDLSFFDFFKILFNTNIISSIPKQLTNINIMIINVIDTPEFILSKDDINKNGKIYKLKSSYLFNMCTGYRHCICGIKNKNTYYVYDSCTTWIKEDWSKLLDNNYTVYPELLNYKKLVFQNKNYIHPDPNYFKFYVAYLIYVLKN